MRFEWLLMAAVPGALGKVFNYKTPSTAMAQAKAEGCDVPSSFSVLHFHGVTGASKMSSYHFTFMDSSTNHTTRCEYNKDSVPAHTDETGSRYACRDKHVQFKWDEEHSSMWMGEEVCYNSRGKHAYMASGATNMTISCLAKTNTCVSKNQDVHGLFTTLQPTH